MKIAFRSLQIFVYAIIALLLFDLITLVGGCQKTAAQKPAAAAVISCQDTSGTYTPTIILSHNAGLGSASVAGTAHFIRVCNEVYVCGIMGAFGSYDTIHFAEIELTVPIGNMTYPVGQAIINQSGAKQPLNATVFQNALSDLGITIKWYPTVSKGYATRYEYTYTIK